MKILIATPLYPPDIGGPATYARTLERELGRRDIETEVVNFGSVKHLPRGVRHVVYFFRLLKEGRTCDVILAQDPFSVGLPAYLATAVLRKCLIVRIAGDFAWEQGVQRFGVEESLDEFAKRKEKEEYHLAVIAMRAAQRFVANHASRVIVPSKYMKKIVASWGVASRQIAVIPNPIEDVSEQGNRRTLRGLLQFRGKMIISIGRLVPWKGFEALIDVMPDILKQFPDTKLVIAGSGPLMDSLEARAEKLGIADHVVLTGSLERGILLRYVKASDVFVLNTSFESFSFQTLEAMSVGVPVITTNIGSLPEVVTNQKNGILIKPDDKKALIRSISSVLGNPAFSKKLVHEGQKTAAQFDVAQVVSEVMREIEKTCGS